MKRKLLLLISLCFLSTVALKAQRATVTTGTGGSSNTIPKFTSSSNIENSVFWDNGASIGATNFMLVNDATTSPYATFLGYQAGASNSGLSCVAFGYRALYSGSNSGNYNAALGVFALYANSSGSNNTATGYGALYANTIASDNTAFGFRALRYNTTGANNTATGSDALYNNTTGSYNTSCGMGALFTNTTSSYNTANGFKVLYYNTSGNSNTGIGCTALYSNTTGSHNNAIGYQALYSNTQGGSNIANGYQALYSNTGGGGNIATGDQALYSNSTGYTNIAIGTSALYTNTGDGNTALGDHALYYNTSGGSNFATGQSALYSNTTGNNNIAIGYEALFSNTTGNYNTAIGKSTLSSITTETNNTALGYGANVSNGYSNSTAIGNGAVANASNKIRLGNASVTVIEGYPASYTQVSDGRFKFNIQEEIKGLEFIIKLRPVTYQMNTHQFDDFLIQNMPDSLKTLHQAGMDFAPSTAIIHSGFIAQEVDSVAQLIGYDFDGVHRPQDIYGNYGLAYSQFVVPLVKAVQEQQKMIDTLNSTIVSLQSQVNTLTGAGEKIMQNNNEEQGKTSSIHNIELANNAVLYQNSPNPFSEGTTIKYFIPDNADVQIIFFDEFGSQIKIFKIEEKGMGTLNVSASNLAAGMYSYSLLVNGRVIDTKKMIKQ